MPIFKLNRKSRIRNLTVLARWGFLFLVVLPLAGCSSSSTGDHFLDPGNLDYSAYTDPFGVDADLVSDDPGVWLQQAHHQRWFGDYLITVQCLDAAAEAVRNYDPQVHPWKKKEMQRQTAMARAWLHYDRGEWQSGLDWARAARRVSPGDASIRHIYGLLAAHSGLRSEAHAVAGHMRRADESDSDINWIEAAYRVSTGQHRQAFNFIMDLRPNGDHQAECWREMGEIAERLGEFSRAGRWYEESFHVLPLQNFRCVGSVHHARLKPGSRKTWQKAWLAFDRFYVTGSLSTYTSLAYARFKAADVQEGRDFWAGQVVNATGILLRKKIDTPWAYRTRGLVFADRGKSDRSIRDLKRASQLLVKLGRPDSEVQSTLGHLFLEKENSAEALKYLRVAADLDPLVASTWQDLGLALIMSDQPKAAEDALTRSLELKPDSATSWYNRGLLHLHRHDYGKAVVDLEKAAALAPENGEVIKLLQQAQVMQRQKRR